LSHSRHSAPCGPAGRLTSEVVSPRFFATSGYPPRRHPRSRGGPPFLAAPRRRWCQPRSTPTSDPGTKRRRPPATGNRGGGRITLRSLVLLASLVAVAAPVNMSPSSASADGRPTITHDVPVSPSVNIDRRRRHFDDDGGLRSRLIPPSKMPPSHGPARSIFPPPSVGTAPHGVGTAPSGVGTAPAGTGGPSRPLLSGGAMH
jgi:hypothetical protein